MVCGLETWGTPDIVAWALCTGAGLPVVWTCQGQDPSKKLPERT